MFILIYGFSQAFWLNLTPLWTFFKNDPWFNDCFKFRISVTCSVLSFKLAFSVFSLSGINGKSLWSSHNFSVYCTSKKCLSWLSSILFYGIFIKVKSVFYPVKSIFSKRHCPPIKLIYLNIWPFFLFIIMFHVFVINFWVAMNRVTYSSSNSFFCY